MMRISMFTTTKGWILQLVEPDSETEEEEQKQKAPEESAHNSY